MPDLKKPFRLGDWTVEPGRLALECGGEERHLEPKAMDMLVFLAAHAGETVTRETLAREIWPGTYGSDEAISRIISLLRSQLGDNSRKPRYIETIPKTGYRLLIHPQEADKSEVRRLRMARYSPRAVGVAVLMGLVGLLLSAYLVWREEPPARLTKAVYTVAVLPFEDISGAGSGQFLSVSLTDEIINSLSRSPQLRIVARNSSGAYREVFDAGDIDVYLEGNLGLNGDRVRVHAEIIDADEGVIRWSDNYETLQTDYLTLQRELSERVFRALNRELGIEVQPPRRSDINLTAYTHYLNGVFLAKLRGEEPLRAAIDAFRNALVQEPGFDNARVALAHVQALLPFYSSQGEDAAFDQALGQLDALDEVGNAEAEAIRGFIAFRQWRWLEAEQHFLDSLTIDPNFATTHVWYSQFLSSVGRLEESLQHARIAYELDSVSAVVNDRLATAHLWNNQDQEAGRLFSAGANLGFNNLQNPSYLIWLLRTGNYEAIRLSLRGLNPLGDLEPLLAGLQALEDSAIRQQLVAGVDALIEERLLLPRLEFGLWIVLEQWSRVMDTIEKYRQQKKYLDVEFLFARESERLRGDPMFQQLTATLGLDVYWQAGQGPDE